MNAEILYGPGNSVAKLTMAASEEVTAEAGAMIAMSGDMDIETTTHKKGGGSILKAAKRMLTGESLFLNHFTAGPNGGELILGTNLAGDMMINDVTDAPLIVQAGSFVAKETSVDMDMGWQGFKTLFSGENLFWLKMTGKGKVLINSFGSIYAVEVTDEYIVDTGHIVAFTENLTFSITKAGKSWISSFLGGEGLVCKFKGSGTVWCQSHNAVNFGKQLGPKLRSR